MLDGLELVCTDEANGFRSGVGITIEESGIDHGFQGLGSDIRTGGLVPDAVNRLRWVAGILRIGDTGGVAGAPVDHVTPVGMFTHLRPGGDGLVFNAIVDLGDSYRVCVEIEAPHVSLAVTGKGKIHNLVIVGIDQSGLRQAGRCAI